MIIVSPQVIRLESSERPKPIRVTNDSEQGVYGLQFSLYNKRKFRFEPASLSLQPHQTKLVQLALLDEKELPSFETQDFAYLKGDNDLNLKLTIFVGSRSRDHSRDDSRASRERNSQIDCDKYSYKELHNLSYIDKLKQSMDGKDPSYFRSREDTVKQALDKESPLEEPSSPPKKLEEEEYGFSRGRLSQTKYLQINEALNEKCEHLHEEKVRLEGRVLQCEDELRKALLSLDLQKQNNRLLSECVNNREAQILSLEEDKRRLGEEIKRFLGIERLFSQKGQQSQKQRQEHERQLQGVRAACQRRVEEFQLKNIELRSQLKDKDEVVKRLTLLNSKVEEGLRARNEEENSMVADLRAKVHGLEASLQAERGQNKSLAEEGRKLEEELEQLRYKCSFYLDSLQRYEKDLLNKNDELVRLKFESSSNAKLVPELVQRLTAQNEKLNEVARRHQEEVSKLRAEERSARARALQLQMQLDDREKDHRAFVQSLQESQEAEKEHLNQTALHLQKMVAQLEGQLQMKERQLQRVKNQAEQNASVHSTQQKANTSSKLREQELKQQLDHAAGIIQELEREIGQFQTANADLQNRNFVLGEKLKLQESEMKQLQRGRQSEENRIEESFNLQSYKESLKSQLREIQEYSKQKIGKLEKQRRKFEERGLELAKLQDQLKRTEGELKRKDKLLQEQQHRVEELADSLEGLAASKDRVVADLKTFHMRNTELQSSNQKREMAAREAIVLIEQKEEAEQKALLLLQTMRDEMRQQAESQRKALNFQREKNEIVKARLIYEFKHGLAEIMGTSLLPKDVVLSLDRKTEAIQNLSHKEALLANLSNKKKAVKAELAKAREKIKALESQIAGGIRHCSRQQPVVVQGEKTPAEAIKFECLLISEQCKSTELANELAKLQEKLGECQQKLFTKENELKKLEQSRTEQDEQLQKLSRQCKEQAKRFHREFESLQSELMQSQENEAKGNGQPVKKSCKQCKRKDCEISKMKADLISSRLRLKTLESEYDRAMDEFKSKEETISQKLPKEQVDQRRSQLVKEMRARINELQKIVEERVQEEERLRAEVRRKEQQVETLRTIKKRETTKEDKPSSGEEDRKNEEISRLQLDLNRVRSLLTQEKKECAGLRAELEEMRAARERELSAANADLMLAKTQCNSLGMVIRRLYGDLQWRMRRSGQQLKLENALQVDTQALYEQVARLMENIKT